MAEADPGEMGGEHRLPGPPPPLAPSPLAPPPPLNPPRGGGPTAGPSPSERRLRIASLLVAAALVGTGAAAGAVRLTRTPPPPEVSVQAPASVVAYPGAPPRVMLPPAGSLALESDRDGGLGQLQPDVVRPIASVAKAMTALVVVEAHPLAADQEGPVLTMTAADVDLYRATLAADGSNLPVREGERLSERQLLLGLLLPSANNLADTLARWISGSSSAFVQRLNSRAMSLGMLRTHFDDASGFSPTTVSTAADLIRLGRALLAEPALAQIVATQSATLPDGTVLHTLDTLLSSEPGWLGIKTGSTPQAGGCLLFAARRPVGEAAAPVTLTGAVLGQSDRAAALQAASQAVDSAFAGYATVDLGQLALGTSGRVLAPWGSSSDLEAASGPPAPVELRQGSSVDIDVVTRPLRAPLASGSAAATVTIRVRQRVVAHRELVLSRALPAPGVGWRLLNG